MYSIFVLTGKIMANAVCFSSNEEKLIIYVFDTKFFSYNHGFMERNIYWTLLTI